MFAGFASTTPTDTHSVYRTSHFVFGSNIYYRIRPQAIRLIVCCPSLRCGTVLVPLVFDNPHLYRLFHDCLRRIALRAAL